MGLVDEDEDVVARARVLPDRLELVNHRDDQAAEVGVEKLLKLGLGVRSAHRDVLLLHFAEHALDPALQLPFELGPIDDEDHGGVLEALLLFEDQLRGREQRERLARALRVPDEAARLGRVGAARDDRVDGAPLMLPQDRFPRLAVLDVEQNPVLERAQEIRALEERLHREAIGLVGRLLPARHVAAGGVPGDAVPIIEQVRDVEHLRRADQFRRLDLVSAKLFDAALDGVAVFRVLVLDDADRHAVDAEHHVRPVALAGGRLQRPFPGDVKDVRVGVLEVDELDAAMALLGLVVPAALAAQPQQHFAVAVDRRRDRVERKVEVGHADLACHQLVQEHGEELVDDGALSTVEVDLAVDRIQDRDDFCLLITGRPADEFGVEEVPVESRISRTRNPASSC